MLLFQAERGCATHHPELISLGLNFCVQLADVVPQRLERLLSLICAPPLLLHLVLDAVMVSPARGIASIQRLSKFSRDILPTNLDCWQARFRLGSVRSRASEAQVILQ